MQSAIGYLNLKMNLLVKKKKIFLGKKKSKQKNNLNNFKELKKAATTIRRQTLYFASFTNNNFWSILGQGHQKVICQGVVTLCVIINKIFQQIPSYDDLSNALLWKVGALITLT